MLVLAEKYLIKVNFVQLFLHVSDFQNSPKHPWIQDGHRVFKIKQFTY